jgi:hypothetical protein
MWIPTLATAREMVASRSGTLPQQLAAADVLVAHAELDAADRFLATLRVPDSAQPIVQRLMAVSARLRKFDAPQKLAAMADVVAHFSRPDELIDIAREHGSGTIVVFSDVTRRFWLSLPVLHLFLAPFGRRVLYLKDVRGSMFLGGLATFGQTYADTLRQLEGLLGPQRREGLHVMTSSAGGFVGLRAAADLGAAGFLGFSPGTDLSPGSTLPLDRLAGGLRERDEHPGMLIDLRPYLEARQFPVKATIYCSRANRLDFAHSDNLRGLRGVRLEFIESASHNVVQHLVAAGTFADALEDFLR